MFNSPQDDLVLSISQEVKLPRILLAIANESIDDEIFLSYREISANAHSGYCIDSKSIISDMSDRLLVKPSTFKIIQDQNEGKKQEIIEILQVELESFKDELEKEKEKNKSLQTKYNNLLETVKSNSERASLRENSLLDLMEEKEEQLSKSIEINIELQNNARKTEIDKKLVQEKNEKIEIQDQYICALENELKKHKEMLKVSDKNREELTNTLVECSHIDSLDESFYIKRRDTKTPEVNIKFDINNENNNDFRTSIDSKSPIIERKNDLLKDRQNYNYSVEPSYENNKYPEPNESCMIKKLIQNTLGKEITKIDKIRDYCYKINSVVISLAVCDDGLYVKNGNNFITLYEH